MKVIHPLTLNPISRIQSREAWERLNTAILAEIGKAEPEVKRELVGFLADLSITFCRKFGAEEKD